MNIQSEILKNTETFATEILQTRLPEHLYYHSYQHTVDVVNQCLKIGKQNQLSPEQIEVVLLAAWLHDIGYSVIANGHEDKSIEFAKDFFATQNISSDKAQTVYECIKATQIPQSPNHLMAQVICDADLSHLAADDFFERCEPLRQEWDATKEAPMSDKEWYEININFLSKHRYFTEYGQRVMEMRKMKNLKKVEKRLQKLLEKEQLA